MPDKLNNKRSTTKALHPRNPHQGRYDLQRLCKTCPELTGFLKLTPAGASSIDFSDNRAVLALNKALLAHYYRIKNWQIPEGYLCPPIPGRADYIHHAADLLTVHDQHRVLAKEQVPGGSKIVVLDIGTGANCIYPIIGSQSFGWKFVVSDINTTALNAAKAIILSNPPLTRQIECRHQNTEQSIFSGIITATDRFDLTLCNPPFHASSEEAQSANLRKRSNLGKSKLHTTRGKHQPNESVRNFGGQNAELWCPGGEIAFLSRMVQESALFSKQVFCFSSLVSKQENVNPIKQRLTKLGAQSIKVVKMSQGKKVSRLIAWSFLTRQQRDQWATDYWQQ